MPVLQQTHPEKPDCFRGGPALPVLKEKVVLHVGQATQGRLAPNASASVTRLPLYKSNEQRVQSPCTA